MNKSITVTRKMRGRPATGVDPVLTVRLPKDLVTRLETWAKRNDTTRSDAIRKFVELGLTAPARKPKANGRK